MKLKKSDQRQLWSEAQRRCDLSDEAVRMAQELGLNPRSLIKNIPSRDQQWKAPVEDWVRDTYAKRRGSSPSPGSGRAATAAQPVPPGERGTRWRLLERFRTGGNAQIWRAVRDDGVRGVVKIPKVREPTAEPYRRFLNEVRFHREHGSAAGVLPALDFHAPADPRVGGAPWVAMLEAVPILDHLGPPESRDLKEVVRVVAGYASTLAELAAHGVAHRDIKPGNLYALDGEPAIGDFGLVEAPENPYSDLTEGRLNVGPRNFLAPEMLSRAAAAGGGPVDVYSLAKTLFVLSTGQVYPPPGEQRLDTEGLGIRGYVPHERAELLDRLIERATRHDPARRPTMVTFRDELRAWLSPPAPPARDGGQALDLGNLAERIDLRTAAVRRADEQRRIDQQVVGGLQTKLKPALLRIQNTLEGIPGLEFECPPRMFHPAYFLHYSAFPHEHDGHKAVGGEGRIFAVRIRGGGELRVLTTGIAFHLFDDEWVKLVGCTLLHHGERPDERTGDRLKVIERYAPAASALEAAALAEIVGEIETVLSDGLERLNRQERNE